ncbi:MAG: hypothetical protein VXX31_15980, partial [Planctomycetota bacterium]|nr:hypothetical protein [Planctomycetota bacterium]
RWLPVCGSINGSGFYRSRCLPFLGQILIRGEFAGPTSPIRVWGSEADRLAYRRSLFVAGVCQSPLLNGER